MHRDGLWALFWALFGAQQIESRVGIFSFIGIDALGARAVQSGAAQMHTLAYVHRHSHHNRDTRVSQTLRDH